MEVETIKTILPMPTRNKQESANFFYLRRISARDSHAYTQAQRYVFISALFYFTCCCCCCCSLWYDNVCKLSLETSQHVIPVNTFGVEPHIVLPSPPTQNLGSKLTQLSTPKEGARSVFRIHVYGRRPNS